MFFLFIFISGCKQQRDFSLLFTSDYAYGNDESYLISYNNQGKPTKTNILEGALFYNLVNYKNTMLVNNGFVEYTLNESEIFIEKFKNFKGYLEPKNVFLHNQTIFNIYNYGSNDVGDYITYIESNNGLKTEVSGYMKNYTIADNKLHLYLSNMETINPSHYIKTLSLDNFEVVNTVTTQTIPGDKIIPIVGTKDKDFFFIEEKVNSDNLKELNLLRVSSKEGLINHTNLVKNLDITSGILPNSSFLEQNKLTIVTDKLEILSYDIELSTLINRTKITENITNKYISIVNKNEFLYILYPGEKLILYEFHLGLSTVLGQTTIQDPPKNMSVFGFLIE